MSNAAQEAAAGLVEDMAGAPEAPQDPETVAVQEEVEAPIDFDLTASLPPDLEEELAEPDFSYDDEPEPSFAQASEAEAEEDEYEDEAVTAEKMKRRALEKKIAWMEGEQLKQNRTRWIEKDLPHFPALASFPNIAKDIANTSTSRRDFGRKALEQNKILAEGMKGYVEKVVGNVDKQKAQQQAELAEAWGSPTTGPGWVPSEAAQHAESVQKIRKAGSLLDATRARLGMGRTNPDDPSGVRI